MTTLAHLRRMRRLLNEPKRWMKHRYSVNGRYCIVGAAFVTADEGQSPKGAIDALFRAAGEPLTTWNDAPGRKHPEVLALLDKAIGAEPGA